MMDDLNALSLPELFRALAKSGLIEQALQLARREDLDDVGDITTASIIPREQRATARLIARQPCVVAGLAVTPLLVDVFRNSAGTTELKMDVHTNDGDFVQAGTVFARLAGPHAAILCVERTLLNLIGRMSGIATMTRRYVDAVSGTGVAICETRKTTPGLRMLEKYAVRCGGGTLHRLGLFDAALYKDNHLALIPPDRLRTRLSDAIRGVRTSHDLRFVGVEVDTIDQLRIVLRLDPGLIDIILLDNMSPKLMGDCVAMRNEVAPAIQLEASGGVTLETVRKIALTGVDRISIGALTHSAIATDVALEIVPEHPA